MSGPAADPYRDGPRYPRPNDAQLFVPHRTDAWPAPVRRPAAVVVAVVLSFVVSGLLAVAAVILFATLAVFAQTQGAAFVVGLHPARFVATGVVDLVAAVLLFGGATAMLAGRPTGRLIQAAGALTVVASSAFWLVDRRDEGSGGVVLVLLFLVPSVLAVVLAWGKDTTAWLAL